MSAFDHHRKLLTEAMEKIMSGELPIAAAQAVAVVSSEISRSIEQEWEMRKYALENFSKTGAQKLLVDYHETE